MLASTDFSESSWTGSGMMEPMYPPAPSMPPAPAPMRDEPMSAPRPKPAKKRKKPSRPKAKKKRSEEHTSELQSPCNLVCRLLLEKKKKDNKLRSETMQPTSMIRYCLIVS